MAKIIALDTETTGLDNFHGCMPYFVTTCDNDGNQVFWEWPVDVKTRKPIIPEQDLDEIKEVIDSADVLVFQNSKFDMKMMDTLGVGWEWDWTKIHDTTISAHLLASSQKKDLTTLALVYLGVNIEPYEKDVEKATQKARRILRTKQFKADHGDWALADESRLTIDMPSGVNWKPDMWLLKAIIQHAPEYLPEWESWEPGNSIEKHPWQTLCEVYANWDSLVTVNIFLEHQAMIDNQGLRKIYEHRRSLLRLVYDMEKTGVTVSVSRTKELLQRFEDITAKTKRRCIILSGGKIEDLPLSGTTKAMKEVLFEDFGLESTKLTDKGNPSVDKSQLEEWILTTRPNSKENIFLQSLRSYRKRMTAISYLKNYSRFGLLENEDYLRLHPSLNLCGTTTLRWSSNNPNEQNITKQEDTNLRYTFGPPPGYVWASFDYENLELRIPAYEAGEADQIALFEEPDAPPYFGSNHLLNFSVIYPDLWEPVLREVGPNNVAEAIKKLYKSTWYQRCKNGNFAVQYGAIERVGDEWSTADKAYGRLGCHSTLKTKFSKVEELNQKCIYMAEKYGYVETLPDKTVDPTRGYPLQCKRTKWGKVLPTVPLNYHVQGTACWTINRAMLDVEDFFQEINRRLKKRYRIVMQIHDELVVEAPLGPGLLKNLKEVKRLMSRCGEYIGIPLRVGGDIHHDNYSKGIAI